MGAEGSSEPWPACIVLVGDRSVGKTDFAHCWARNSAIKEDDYHPTIFSEDSCIVCIGGRQIEVSMWDTAGQEDYPKLMAGSLQAMDIGLLLFSYANPMSLENIRDRWAPLVFEHAKHRRVLMLVGIGSDLREDYQLREAMGECPFRESEVEDEMVQKVVADIGADRCVYCCLDSNHQVQMVVEKALELFVARVEEEAKEKKKPKKKKDKKKEKKEK